VNRLLQFKCNRGYVQGVSYFVQEELKACALQWMLTDELQLNHARDLTLTGIGRTTPLPKDARAQVERYYATPDMAALCASYMTF
jgi:hypothetical protein